MTSTIKTSTVKIGKAFRVALPAEFREQYALKEGKRLSAVLENGRLVLMPLREQQQAVQAKYAGRFPGMLGELFAKRRAEVQAKGGRE